MTKRKEKILTSLLAMALAAPLAVGGLPSVYAEGLQGYEARGESYQDMEISNGTYLSDDGENVNNSLPTYQNRAASSEELSGGERARKINYSLPPVSNKSIYSYQKISASLGGINLGREAIRINDIYYLPVRASFAALGASVSYSSATRTITVRMKGLTLTATDGAYVVYANDRPLFNFSPAVVMSNGRMYIPASTVAKALGLSMSTSGGVLLSGSVNPLKPASQYYREDEVLWLGRIIMAEAGGESLLGQIAVGDVILNRVKSSQFPNTIWGVIFDKRYGIQFSPVANGTIYNSPSFTATLAAKICLEGVSLSDNAMYFLNPRIAHSSWIVNNRPYAYTIGNHDFYL